eukprot:CAMPEP_0206502574 /NCGR_PEP_ID=MMETSP0324_2-20121206/54087_1 /ASSEMBLY_ACC=CAM_ASM_000836 /TAXON_ID=2866 /ORGANISM="Crypthecodinium cohnii, Strain Seligo" /LENGTH=1241 /DNA_ID=CAMNT_0053990811 /DNA_START=18 /DNA_END=3743 /DNA_ORIENTATION=+
MDCGVFNGCLTDGKGGTLREVTHSTETAESFDPQIHPPALDQSAVAVPVKLESNAPSSGWNDPEKVTPVPMQEHGSVTKPILKRGLSNFSTGSNGSKKSMKSQGSTGSFAGSKGGGGGDKIAKRWSLMLEGGMNTIKNGLQVVLKDDERMVNFDENRAFPGITPTALNHIKGGRPNKIRTTQFTPLTWLPLSLLNQFKRIANIYFLFIACLVVWPWSPKNWKSKIFPFMAVLFWTALKDLYEDIRRKRDDDAENKQRCWRSSSSHPDTFEEVAWSEILVGDIVLVPEDSAFPADLILLHPAGGVEAFISTVMLDGETSLKVRQAPGLCEQMSKKCAKLTPGEWTAVQTTHNTEFPSEHLRQQMGKYVGCMKKPGVEFKFPSPSAVLSDVRGTLQITGNSENDLVCPFTEDNFLPRGCILKNTPFILGLCLYVGDDSKTRLNASTAKLKFSNMQRNLNKCVQGLLVCLFSLCIIATIIAFAAEGSLAAEEEELIDAATNPLIRFFMFCVTFYHVVPMSLYVIYEMLKLVLAFQVNTDAQMYDPVREIYAQARTAEVMEEAGQVNFLFSDKTGTLTANEMVFARCHCADGDMGEFRKNADGSRGDGMEMVRNLLSSGKTSDVQYQDLLNLFTCLAVCHSVQVIKKDDGELSFSAMSPDEVALVEASHNAGISFVQRIRKSAGNTSDVLLRGPGTVDRKFTILHELAFNSDRKRMSVVAKHKGSIWIITKGADSVMEGLLRNPFTDKCAYDLNKFSKQGLRTLIVGMRSIDQTEFDTWNAEYTAARNLIDETKEAKMAEIGARLERDLKFVGITAVEDRLQDGVPEAISTLKEAGIRVWVLTGDKTETAVDIARSCKLFTESTNMSYATGATGAKDAEDKLLKAHSQLDGKADTGLVLDGQTVLHALESPECRKIIYDLGILSRSCICSRLSPMQKLELVKLVRQQNPLAITLAIGDGANDVPMIQGAHVGVAIRGKEGTQAVQASDIAISYFRFVVPLLLCHGRKAYRRVALFLSFYLYKNVVLLMSDVIWMFIDKFRARIAFPEYLSVGFNVLYSAWHILFVLGFDRDISDALAVARPALYKVGPSRSLFNLKVFFRWIFFGLAQGAIAFSVPYAMIGTKEYNKKEPGQFWICSTVIFTGINLIVCIKLLMYCESPLKLTSTLSTAGAGLCFIICVFLLGHWSVGIDFQPSMEGVPADTYKSGKNWGVIAITTAAALALDVIWLGVGYFAFPSELSLAKRGK